MAGNGQKPGARRLTASAITMLEKLGCEPMSEIVEALYEAKAKFKSGGNIDENGRSDQAQFLALWIKSAETLAKFKYPTLSAVAVKDLDSSNDSSKVMTAAQAVKVLKADPFAPKEIKEIDTSRVIESIDTSYNPSLPIGLKNISSTQEEE